MQTPGFEEEEKTKPQESKEIEGTATTVSAEHAAESLWSNLKLGALYLLLSSLFFFQRNIRLDKIFFLVKVGIPCQMTLCVSSFVSLLAVSLRGLTFL